MIVFAVVDAFLLNFLFVCFQSAIKIRAIISRATIGENVKISYFAFLHPRHLYIVTAS